MKVKDTEIFYDFEVKDDMLNDYGILHGGEMVKAMDASGGVCTVLFTKYFTMTAAINNVMFFDPVEVGEKVRIKTKIIYTGRTSILCEAEAYILDDQVADDKGEKLAQLVAKSYLTFVAIDQNKPVEVPKIEYEKEEEKNKYLKIKKLLDELKILKEF